MRVFKIRYTLEDSSNLLTRDAILVTDDKSDKEIDIDIYPILKHQKYQDWKVTIKSCEEITSQAILLTSNIGRVKVINMEE